MKRKRQIGRALGLVLTGLAGLAGGCRNYLPIRPEPAPEISLEQRREMQIHDWDAPLDAVFGATIAELQDQGWTLDSVDRVAGIIRSSTTKSLEPFGPEDEKFFDLAQRKQTAKERADVAKKWTRWMEAVIHIESWENGKTRQRIVLNRRGTLPSMSYLERLKGPGMGRGRDVMINAPAVEQTVEIDMPEAYQDWFDRIEGGIKRRKQGIGSRE